MSIAVDVQVRSCQTELTAASEPLLNWVIPKSQRVLWLDRAGWAGLDRPHLLPPQPLEGTKRRATRPHVLASPGWNDVCPWPTAIRLLQPNRISTPESPPKLELLDGMMNDDLMARPHRVILTAPCLWARRDWWYIVRQGANGRLCTAFPHLDPSCQ